MDQSWRIAKSIAIITASLISISGFSAHPKPDVQDESTCGTLLEFEGDVKILSHQKTRFVEVKKGVSLPCSSFIQTRTGWVQVEHEQGFQFRISQNSSVQIFLSDLDGQSFSDHHLTLFRGAVFVENQSLESGILVETPNALAKVSSGISIISYLSKEEKSQLVVFTEDATLENKFERSQKVKVTTGEVSSLDLSNLRVTPTNASSIATVSLKGLVEKFGFSPGRGARLLSIAKRNAEKSFGESLAKNTDHSSSTAKRSIASSGQTSTLHTASSSVALEKGKTSHGRLLYKENSRAPASFPKVTLGKERLVGGEKSGVFLLSPGFKEDKKKILDSLKKLDSE